MTISGYQSPHHLVERPNYEISSFWQYIFSFLPGVLWIVRLFMLAYMEWSFLQSQASDQGHLARAKAERESKDYVYKTAPGMCHAFLLLIRHKLIDNHPRRKVLGPSGPHLWVWMPCSCFHFSYLGPWLNPFLSDASLIGHTLQVCIGTILLSRMTPSCKSSLRRSWQLLKKKFLPILLCVLVSTTSLARTIEFTTKLGRTIDPCYWIRIDAVWSRNQRPQWDDSGPVLERCRRKSHIQNSGDEWFPKFLLRSGTKLGSCLHFDTAYHWKARAEFTILEPVELMLIDIWVSIAKLI